MIPVLVRFSRGSKCTRQRPQNHRSRAPSNTKLTADITHRDHYTTTNTRRHEKYKLLLLLTNGGGGGGGGGVCGGGGIKKKKEKKRGRVLLCPVSILYSKLCTRYTETAVLPGISKHGGGTYLPEKLVPL